MPKTSQEAMPEEIQDRLNSFQNAIEEAVIMANVLAQELSSNGDDMKQVADTAGTDDFEITREKLLKLTDLASQITDLTGKAEVEISRYLATARGQKV